jgi:hypothetical protein
LAGSLDFFAREGDCNLLIEVDLAGSERGGVWPSDEPPLMLLAEIEE